jgi:hypothetical protein
MIALGIALLLKRMGCSLIQLGNPQPFDGDGSLYGHVVL